MKELFKMGGSIDKKTSTIISLIGLVVLLAIWYFLTLTGEIIPNKILPNPVKVLLSYGELYTDYDLLPNTWYSIKLNIYGYITAILLALPIGFIIGMFPIARSLFSQYIDAFRFLPLTAITGIFIAWFGIGFDMKVYFLSFGILIYLLPVIVQRINELQNPSNNKDYVYLQTITTLGATNWQKFRHVYFPYVTEKISEDIRVLTAISWTYIIVAELLNKEGGIGSMIYTLGRQSRTPEVFALLFLIILIGFTQDRLFKSLDQLLFPSKYNYEKGRIKKLFVNPSK
ncbi:MAG: ABC transporter permease subunit [Tannerellaceae bacterium]|nr:ABC transporter permease subunit [Tannerellaceae bacterium]MCD8179264.1 ABC transporter permease subunit [Tannerellaceae bacterium]